MTEARLWRKFMLEWPGHGVRIEASAGGCDPGTPDANISCAQHGMWLELKVWPTPVSPIQLAWHLDADQRGARALVLCWVTEDEYWVGSATRYDAMTGTGTRPSRRLEGIADVVKHLLRLLR
jgi:hypothetical protein